MLTRATQQVIKLKDSVLMNWLEKKQRKYAVWFGKTFRAYPKPQQSMMAIFCDFEGHYTGLTDAEQFAESGTDKLLSILRKHQLQITFDTVAELCISHPERVKKVIADGHEIACHAWRHETPKNLSAAEIDNMLANAQRCFKQLDLQVKGFRSPQSAWSMSLIKALPKYHYEWSAERGNQRNAYRISKDIIRLEVATDDWPIAAGTAEPEILFKYWKDLAIETKQQGGIICFGIHEWIVGKYDEYANQLDSFLQQAKQILPVKKMGDIVGEHKELKR